MAELIVDIANIAGESVKATYAGKLEAIAINDVVRGPVGQKKTKLSEICVTRDRDRASPKLAQACAAGTDLGQVTIHLFDTVVGRAEPYLTYTLTNTYVSRIEFDTVETNGIAYLPHNGYSSAGAPTWRPFALYFGATVNDSREYARDRARPNPLYFEPPGVHTNKEIERVWLSAGTVKWTYTPYDISGAAEGVVESGWNNLTGETLAGPA